MFGDLFRAFRAGQELANAETWKKRQVLVNAMVAILTAVVALAAAFGHPLNLDAQGVQAIAASVAALVGLFNGAATVATTSRVGLPPAADDPPGPGSDGGDPVRLDPANPDVFGTGNRG